MEGKDVGEGREPVVDVWLGVLRAGDGERSLRFSEWVIIGGGWGESMGTVGMIRRPGSTP